VRASPVMFIQNVGQFADGARFQVRGGDKTIWLAEDALWVTVSEQGSRGAEEQGSGGAEVHAPLHLRPPAPQPKRGVNIRLSFPGANPHPRLEPFHRLDTVVSYFIGNDPAKWHVAVPVWGGVRYVDLYPGVDLELTGENGQVVPRLVAHPGADLSAVRLRVEGAKEVALLPSPDVGRGAGGEGLLLRTALGDFTLPLFQVEGRSAEPAQAQRVDGLAFEVSHPFTAGNEAVRAPSSMVHSQQAVSLLYAGFLGGSYYDYYDYGYGIAVDSSGNAYVTGYTWSGDFPAVVGPDLSHNGYTDAFVAKVNPSGTALVYAGFLGGSYHDYGYGIAVDSSGNAYVTGSTRSSDFPAVVGPDLSFNGYTDAFVAKVNPSGTALVYAGFLGGSSEDAGRGIAVDSSGNAYVTGWTWSSDFPAVVGPDTSHNGGYYDAFVAKVNPSGTALVYAGFLGGSGWDGGHGIAVDSSGNAYVTGYNGSSDFPAVVGPDTSYNGGGDAFVAKVNPSGTALVYAGFLGGSYYDYGCGIAVDSSGNAYVTGYTGSSDFPAVVGPDTSYNGGGDAFVAKVNPSGTALVYAGFLGGSSEDAGRGIAVDSSGNAYVTGVTKSSDFPAVVGPDTSYNGGGDAFVAKVNPSGTALVYAGFLGGSGWDEGHGIAVDSSGNAYVTGVTESSDFPAVVGPDTSHNGDGDAFVAKVGAGGLSISHIEVTQATQDANNSVPLIAGKPTLVRVYVSCPPGGEVPAGATVALRGYGSSGELPGSPLAPFGGYLRTACRESLAQQRADLRKTFNFALPNEWTQGTITLRAEVGEAVGEEPATFQQAKAIRIAFVPIHYDPEGRELLCPKDPDMNYVATAHSWAERVFPLGTRIQIDVWSTMYWTMFELRNPPGCLAPGKENYTNTIKLLQTLEAKWLLYKGDNKPDYVFGWLPRYSYFRGASYPRWYGAKYGVAAFADDFADLQFTRQTFAHEIGHLMGRRHTNTLANLDDRNCQLNPQGETSQKRASVDPDSDWVKEDGRPGPPPFLDSKIQDYGVDIISESSYTLKRPDENYDYMSYCGSLAQGNVWTSPWTYSHIFSETLRLQGAAQAIQAMTAITQPYFIASGLVYTDDTAIIDPIWVITPTEVPQNPPAGTQYCLEAQDAGGTVLSGHCFDLAFRNYETGEATGVDGFNLMLPYPSGVARIVLRKGAQQLAVRPVSAHVPTVTVLFPNGGETWAATGTYTITWTASDADGDPLAYSVLYSPNGSDWLPVAAGITQTQVAVNAAELAGDNAARVRVLASDGVHTTADESDAPFTVARKALQAFILSPERDIIIAPGTPLWLQGYAYDLEDGTLPDTALRWSSSRDGNLGTGSQVLVSLSPGEHVITLTATDSDGNVTTATVQVYVGHKIYLPLVLRNR
jgi:hypothetical protein